MNTTDSSAPQDCPASVEGCGDSSIPRRGFLPRFLAVAIGGVAGIVPMFSGLAVFFSPLFQRKAADGGDGFYRVVGLDELTDVPQSFKIVADRRDAWTVLRNESVGSVYLQKIGPAEIRAFNVICPHFGCAVAFRGEKKSFLCPCHNSAFALDGAVISPSPSPRNLDALEWQIRDGSVWVKFQDFIAGHKEKIANT